MKACTRRPEVIQAIRSGQWPQAAPSDLRAHVDTCASCFDEARILSAFAASRQNAMRIPIPQSAELLWWKAQLRRRQQAMERLEYSGLAVSTVTIAASLLIMLTAVAATWKRIAWSHVVAQFTVAQWNTWIVISVAASLCAFAAVAVVLGVAKERG